MTNPHGDQHDAPPPHIDARSRTVEGLHVESAGNGDAVVLIHAGVADSRMWEPQWARWPLDYTVVRVDLRGFGRSAAPNDDYCHAADVLSVLDALAIGRATLVGASYGGLVSLDLALSHPERLRGLVLVDSPIPEHAWSEAFERFGERESEALEAGDIELATEINVNFWLADAEEPIRHAIRAQQRRAFELQVGSEAEESLLTSEFGARLGSLEIPTLVIDGADDVVDFNVIADQLARTIPRAERATIQAAGHLPSLEQPEAFEAIVRPFLLRLEST